MAFDLPNSPATGDTYVLGGKTWRYDGNAWVGVSPLSPGMVFQVFTSSGTYTPSPGMKFCVIECVGSGGAGGGVALSSGSATGGGGGGGSYARKLASAATIGASQTVTVGAAGTAGAAGNNAGNAGSDVSVGTICIGKGGSGGGGSAANTVGGGLAGAGGVAGTGDYTVPGAPGVHGGGGTITTLFIGSVGYGGASGREFGVGGSLVYSNTGSAGGLYGGGGAGGASYASSADRAGGAGGKGIVVITEFVAAGGAGIASTDNAIARYDGTAGLLQNSGITINDTNFFGWSSGVTAGYTAASIAGTRVINLDFPDDSTGFNGLQITNAETGVGGPFIFFHHNSPSPAAGDRVGSIDVYGRDSAGNTNEYGYLQCRIGDPTNGSEDSHWILTSQNAGVASEMTFVPGGIQFPLAQIAQANANTLDDYEEGTWTPAYVTDANQFTSVTYAVGTTGRYTKIGQQVTVNAILYTTAVTVGAASGNIYVGVMPFTPAASFYNTCRVLSTIAWAGETPMGGIVGPNSPYVGLVYRASVTGIDLRTVVADVSTGAANNEALFTVSYTT